MSGLQSCVRAVSFAALLLLGGQSAWSQSSLDYQVVVDLPMSLGIQGANILHNVEYARDNLHATAICLRIDWDSVETAHSVFSWAQLDAALDNITNSGLNVFVRIYMANDALPAWAYPGMGVFTNNDFMARHDGSIDLAPNAAATNPNITHTFSYANQSTRTQLINSYTTIAQHIYNHLQNQNREDRLLAVTPVMTFFEEMEYPWPDYNEGTGYENTAIVRFTQYLAAEYNTIADLNADWGSNYPSFSTINPRLLNWHIFPTDPLIANNQSNYVFAAGRKHWFVFRQRMLKEFIDAFAAATHGLDPASPPRFGWRAGSVIRTRMEQLGYYDLTSLIENVDWVHVAPIIDHEATHEIEADYLRSICNYWSARTGRTVRFSEESNWPNYNLLLGGGIAINDAARNAGWINEIEAYRTRGCSAHFIFGWDGQLDNAAILANTAAFRNHLDAVDNSTILAPSPTGAIHISEARMMWAQVAENCFFPIPEVQSDGAMGYIATPLASLQGRSLLPESNFTIQVYNPAVMVDFLTDYMINASATNATSLNYINSYNGIYLPRGSYHMSEQTLENLLSEDINIPIVNATHYVDTKVRFLTVPARRDVDNTLLPEVARIIWRTRADVHGIWPDANYAAAGSGWEGVSFIDWLVNNNLADPEYPEISDLFVDWNDDVKSVRNERADLQNIFPDGFHGTGSWWTGKNILFWLTQFGVNEYPQRLGKYANWPYSVN